MMRLARPDGKGKAPGILVAAGILAAALMASTGAVQADDDHRHRKHQHQKHHQKGHNLKRLDHYHHGYVYPAVPRRLHSHEHKAYRSYYAGRTYYRPHHHYHATYRFPVYVGGAVLYRPYYYCQDQIFLSVAAPLPRLALSFQWGSPAYGFYGSGYYSPNPYSPYHHDRDWDDYDD